MFTCGGMGRGSSEKFGKPRGTRNRGSRIIGVAGNIGTWMSMSPGGRPDPSS